MNRRKKERGVYEREPGSGVWCVRVWYRNKTWRRTVGARKLAKEVYQQWRADIAAGRFFPERQQDWDPQWAEFVSDYAARNASGLVDPGDAERYARFWLAAPETKGKTMTEIRRADAEHYRERRRRESAPGAIRPRGGASPSTVNKELSWARACFNDYIAQREDKGLSPVANPFATSRRRSRRLYYPEPATRTRHLGSAHDDEAARLLAALPTVEARAIVLVACFTGFDRGVVLGLEWTRDVDFAARTVRGWRRKGGGAERVYYVPMDAELEGVLRALPSRQNSRWVFPNSRNTGPLDGRDFDRLVFQPALIRAGINTMDVTTELVRVRAGRGMRTVTKVRRRLTRTLRFKDLRHTFASWLRLNGSELLTIRDLLGHTSTRMTERYAHINNDTHRRAVDGLRGRSRALVQHIMGATDTSTDTSARSDLH